MAIGNTARATTRNRAPARSAERQPGFSRMRLLGNMVPAGVTAALLAASRPVRLSPQLAAIATVSALVQRKPSIIIAEKIATVQRVTPQHDFRTLSSMIRNVLNPRNQVAIIPPDRKLGR